MRFPLQTEQAAMMQVVQKLLQAAQLSVVESDYVETGQLQFLPVRTLFPRQ